VTTSAVWNLSGNHAHLKIGDLRATVDIARPGLGLHAIIVRGQLLTDARLLAAQFAETEPNAEQPLADSFIRGNDLVLTYAPTPTRPVRMQVYWRAFAETDAPQCAGAVEMQVSVQTNLLDAWPALILKTDLANTVIAPVDCDSAPESLMPMQSAAVRSGADCWLCHPRDAGWSYVEMAHPADVERAELQHSAARAELSHYLFHDSLEKGVILRARARGIFVPTTGDEATARNLYERFLAAPLPLTT
jgi:hypothetical protein